MKDYITDNRLGRSYCVREMREILLPPLLSGRSVIDRGSRHSF